MDRRLVLAVCLIGICWGTAALAISGADSAPGQACSPNDAVRLTAYPGGTGAYVLTCQAGVWSAQITASAPTQANHVATKAYVDAATGLAACVNDDTSLCAVETNRATNDPDLIPSNIRNGVNILGVVGVATFSTTPATCPNVGDVCSDGSVYAGTQLVTGYRMYVTPADATGTYQYQTSSTTTSATGAAYGRVNTRMLSPAYSAPAAAYCANLSAHTHDDWFLPANDELQVLYNNRTPIGGFAASQYWSSVENSSSNAYYLNFSSGTSGNTTKVTSYKVRCVRYDEDCHQPGMDCQDGSIYAGTYLGHIYYTTTADQSAVAYWGTNNYSTGATSADDGQANQTNVYAHVMAGDGDFNPGDGYTPNAFVLCQDLTANGKTDWFLASYNEIANTLNSNRVVIGGFGNYYWTSNENSSTGASYYWMGNGIYGGVKSNTYPVRCVRRN